MVQIVTLSEIGGVLMRIKLDALDKLVSEYIRRKAIKEVGGCERCLAPKYDIVKEDGSIFPAWQQLQCCHFHGRGNHSVRYDPDNLAGLDFGCHQFLDSHPLEKIEFFKQRLGEDRFNMLNSRMRQMGKPDKKLLTLYYQSKIKEVDNGN